MRVFLLAGSQQLDEVQINANKKPFI